MTVVNQRHNYVMKDILIPILVGVIIGAVASIATNIYLSAERRGEVEGRFNQLERSVNEMKVIMVAVQTNQIAIASGEVWKNGIEKLIDSMSKQINIMQSDRYTKEDGARDREASIKADADILREINLRHKGD